MKYLIFIIALLLSTPTFAEEKKPELNGFMSQKPVVCGNGMEFYDTISSHADETPFASWNTEDEQTSSIMLINKVKNTITILEYMPSGLVACITAVGINLQFVEDDKDTKEKKEIKGTPIRYLTK